MPRLTVEFGAVQLDDYFHRELRDAGENGEVWLTGNVQGDDSGRAVDRRKLASWPFDSNTVSLSGFQITTVVNETERIQVRFGISIAGTRYLPAVAVLNWRRGDAMSGVSMQAMQYSVNWRLVEVDLEEDTLSDGGNSAVAGGDAGSGLPGGSTRMRIREREGSLASVEGAAPVGMPALMCPASTLADLEVHVFGTDGLQIQGAAVHIEGLSMRMVRSARTDGDGMAVFRSVCPDEYEVTAHGGRQSGRTVASVYSGSTEPNAARAEIELPVRCDVEVTVVDGDRPGRPGVGRATVTVRGGSRFTLTRHTPAADGANEESAVPVRFDALVPQEYAVDASAEGYDTTHTSVTLTRDETIARVTIRLHRSGVRARFIHFRTDNETDPRETGVRLGVHPNDLFLTNAAAIRFDVPARPVREYRFRRTLEEKVWQRVRRVWSEADSSSPGTSDHWDPDEFPAERTTPPHLYDVDAPGWYGWGVTRLRSLPLKGGSGRDQIDPQATEVVLQQNFLQWVELKTGQSWSRISENLAWCNQLWLRWDEAGSRWTVEMGERSFIRRNHLTMGVPR